MPRRSLWLIVSFFVFFNSWRSPTPVPPGTPPPTVTLEAGILQGLRFGATDSEVAFLGIPYAAPPVGDLRWKSPQPAVRWNGVRHATQFGAACPQLRASWFPYIGWSEDCLYLNVWTKRPSANAHLPVIVYFHGGSNTAGYAQMTPLGPALARMGVVVVSANYRLGPMGFLAHPALSRESEHHSSGNYGLLDQLRALQWVGENISHFGGDPSRITVMGQSAGSVDICLLIASPMAAGLFQRAIMESGDCQSDFNKDIRTPIQFNLLSGTGEGAGERLATDLGIANGPDALKKLRAVPVDQILSTWSKDPKIHFDAIVDGWVVPEQPAKIFAERREMKVSVLVGSNADEATVFGHGGPKTVKEYEEYLIADTGTYAKRELQEYPAASETEVAARYLQLQNDSFAYGAYSMAKSVTSAGQKAYLYYFTYAETGKRAPLGAYHGEELMFLSDSFPDDWEHNQDAERLGKILRTYWTKFATTGNPNAPGLPDWPPYHLGLAQRFELGRAIGLRQVPEHPKVLEHIMNQIFAGIG